MYRLYKINLSQSIAQKKLVFPEDWFEKLDRGFYVGMFLVLTVISLLAFFDPYRDPDANEYYIFWPIAILSVYSIIKRVDEKRLRSIDANPDAVINKARVMAYGESKGWDKKVHKVNLLVFTSPNAMGFHDEDHTSRIFLFRGDKVYVGMLREGRRLNTAIWFSDFYLRRDLRRLFKNKTA